MIGARTGVIPFIDLAAQQQRIEADLRARLDAVLDHGRYIMGPEVIELEEALCRFTGATNTVGCASGTDALVMSLLALDVRPGDAVLVPTFTFAATAEAVALIGATPVFGDVDPVTFTIDPTSVGTAMRISEDQGLRLVGMIAVDLFGVPADYDALGTQAGDHGLWILGDAAQSLGAQRGSTPVGTLAAATTTSFFPAKPLGCYGDGGAVITDDDELAERLRSIRVHGQGTDKYDNVRIGINGRLDTIQAAVLLAKLAVFPDELEARRRLASRYTDELADVVRTPVRDGGAHRSSWAQYTVLTEERDRVADHLRSEGVPTAVYYPRPLHQQTAYRAFPTCGALEVAEHLSHRVLSLPMHPYLREDVQDHIIDAVRRAAA